MSGSSSGVLTTSRIRAAKVYACSRPTSPWRAQGNRLSVSGATHRNRIFSSPINASATSTEGGSPGIGVSWPVRALNHTRPRIPVNLLIDGSPLGNSREKAQERRTYGLSSYLPLPSWFRPVGLESEAALQGPTGWKDQAQRCGIGTDRSVGSDELPERLSRSVPVPSQSFDRHRHRPKHRRDLGYSVVGRRR